MGIDAEYVVVVQRVQVIMSFYCGAHRGHGMGAMLIAGIVDDCRPLGLRRIALSTDDAQGPYARFGFAPLAISVAWMERLDQPNS